jgi:hypothetical protein
MVLPSLGVFSLAGSFRCIFLLFVLSARFMLLGSFFTWVYFLLEPFFCRCEWPVASSMLPCCVLGPLNLTFLENKATYFFPTQSREVGSTKTGNPMHRRDCRLASWYIPLCRGVSRIQYRFWGNR